MIGFFRALPARKQGETLLSLALAAAIVVLGVLVYFQLVTALLEYAG